MPRLFTKGILNNLELGVGALGSKFHGKSVLSFSAYVKWNSFEPGGGTVDRLLNVVIGNVSGAVTGVTLAVNSGHFRLGARATQTDAFQTLNSSTTLVAGTSYWVGGVIDFATPSMRVYVNGVQVGTSTPTFGATTYTQATSTLTDKVGGASDASNNLDGEISELAIWDTDITTEGFAQLTVAAAPTLRRQNLLFYMPLVGRYMPEPDLVGGLTGTVPSSGSVPAYGLIPRLVQSSQVIPLGLRAEDISILDGEGQSGSNADATMTVTVDELIGQARIFARAGIARAGYTRSGYYFQNVLVYLNGVDVSANLWRNSLKIEDIINDQADLANLRLFGVDVSHGNQLIISLGSANNRIFGGTVQKPKKLHTKGIDKKIYSVPAVDWTFMLNRRKVYKRYTALNLHQIVVDIITNFTTGFTTTNVKSPSPNIPEIEFSGETVAQALTRACGMAENGWDWYPDPNRDIHCFDEEAVTNPHSLIPTNLDFWALNHDADWSQIRTRVYVQGGGSVTTASVAANSTEIPVETAVWYSSTGGQVQFNGQIINYTGKTATSLTGIPSSGPGSITHTIAQGSNINIRVMAEDTAAQVAAALAAGEGDGIHEYNITDQRLSIAGANARAVAELSLFKDPIIQGSYQTFERNIRSGATLTINLPGRLVGTFKITKVISELVALGRIRKTVFFSSALPQDFYALLRSAAVESENAA